MIRLGVSGSTVMSEPDRLGELFWDGIDHIEVGSLSSSDDLDFVLARARQQGVGVGFHSPLFKGGSKYDLLKHIQQSPEAAWQQLEEELAIAKTNQAEYVLVHFPYFLAASEADPIPQIEAGLDRLAALQAKYSTKILCEPKLGAKRDPGGIEILKNYPVEQWRRFGLPMCWDMGDYILATNSPEEYLAELRRWADLITVVHVHNVKISKGYHYWIAIHPSQEDSEEFLPLKPFFAALKELEVLLVWEHTPHVTPNHDFALEGFQWAKTMLGLA